MKRKTVWLVLSCLMVLSLALASCAPAATEEKKAVTEEKVTTEEKAAQEVVTKEEVAPVTEKPKYGGTITVALIGTGVYDTMGRVWDQTFAGPWWGVPLHWTNEELLIADWTRGPAGTGEVRADNLAYVGSQPFYLEVGHLAESWEIPDNQTIIFHIRKGVNWHNKPPVNGREFTAADVVFNIKYEYFNPRNPRTYNVISAPGGKRLTDVYLDPDDPWTVVVKVEDLAVIFLEDVGDKLWMYAPEIIEQYGNAQDWKNSLGTGPFMVTDYVTGSSVTLVRNPSYWYRDPVGPGKGNQLPYVDGVTALTILDKATRMAAVRTGKADYLYDLEWEDADSLRRTNPEINLSKYYGSPLGLSSRITSTDPRAAPLLKIRVRQALAMAIDNPSIIRDYYGGNADLVQHFWFPGTAYYTPLEEMAGILQRVHGFSPEEAKILEKMYGYHPEEARRILAEEGYPDGFKTTLIVTAPEVDLFSIVKGYLAKINVDVEFDVREVGVATTIRDAHTQPALGTSSGNIAGWAERWMFLGPADPALPRNVSNHAEVNDPVVNDAIRRSDAAWAAGDLKLRNQVIKEAEPYIFSQAWYIQLPSPHKFVAYQPWLKNNYGIHSVGNRNGQNWPRWAWIDQDLKQEITGKR